MVKRSVSFLVSMVALGGFATAVSAAEPKIGVINTNVLMQESPQARAANQVIQTEFTPRQKDYTAMEAALQAREDKLRKDAATMTDVQRAAAEKELRDGYRDLQVKRSEIEDDLNTRRNEELSKLQNSLLQEVHTYAQAQGYDIVLADGVLFASPAFDITAPVLQALQNRAKAPAAAPAKAPAASPAAPAKP